MQYVVLHIFHVVAHFNYNWNMTDDVSVHADLLIGNVMRTAKRSSRRTVELSAQSTERRKKLNVTRLLGQN